MLKTLNIERFAIIEQVSIEFQRGFTVLSGETGAGKSILIDALNVILGARADTSVIQAESKKATLSAFFSPLPATVSAYLSTQELTDDDAPNGCLLRRVLREKSSKAYINDVAVTSGALKQATTKLVSIHGQHENYALMRPAEQLRRLDRYAKLDALAAETAQSYRQLQQAKAELLSAQEAQERQAEKLSLLAYQLDELTQLAPKPGEFSQISAQHQELSSTDALLQQGEKLTAQLEVLAQQFSPTKQLASKLSALSGRFEESEALIKQSAIYLQEASDALMRELSRTEHDPNLLAALDARMSALHQLARKYHCQADELAELHNQIANAYQAHQTQQHTLENLEQALTKHQAQYDKLAKALSAARQEHAPMLADTIRHYIAELGMRQATVYFSHQHASASATGIDEMCLMLSANAGQPARPLGKIASGGELSRVSLALEVACIDETPIPTIIFDEIDTGIGGEIANTIGRLLRELSQTRQVLCITHLPQVAAYADHHYLIEKTTENQKTRTQVIALDHEARLRELARMLGDMQSTASQAHAKALLAQSQSPP